MHDPVSVDPEFFPVDILTFFLQNAGAAEVVDLASDCLKTPYRKGVSHKVVGPSVNGFPCAADVLSVGTFILNLVSFLDQTAAFCIDARNRKRPAERGAGRCGLCGGLCALCCRSQRSCKCEKQAQKDSEQTSTDSFVHEKTSGLVFEHAVLIVVFRKNVKNRYNYTINIIEMGINYYKIIKIIPFCLIMFILSCDLQQESIHHYLGESRSHE